MSDLGTATTVSSAGLLQHQLGTLCGKSGCGGDSS